MSSYLFTSESVAIGHPDKTADQISDAVLDAYLQVDPTARVACETLVTSGLVVLAGEISSIEQIELREIVRAVIQKIGYTDASIGFDADSFGLLTSIHQQSPDIAIGVDSNAGKHKSLGAGDQGIMFGFACDETLELMPYPIMTAHSIMQELKKRRENDPKSYLRPDAKTQITVEYGEDHRPRRIHTVVLSTQHQEDVPQEKLHKDMLDLIKAIVPGDMLDGRTIYHINPTGRFVHGGPAADTGLTGRKIIVDTYGGMGRHGGGAFSGKDPTKVDRSASYAARYIAKNIVAAKIASRCEVQISYGIGIDHPISINIHTYGTGAKYEKRLSEIVPKIFDLTPKGIIDMLDLCRPIYLETAFGGHFGRSGPGFTWENTDKTKELLALI